MAHRTIKLEELSKKNLDLRWSVSEGHVGLHCKLSVDLHGRNWSIDVDDTWEVKGAIGGAVHEGFWLPDKIWESLRSLEEHARVSCHYKIYWVHKEKGKSYSYPVQPTGMTIKLIKGSASRFEDVPGHHFKLYFESERKDYQIGDFLKRAEVKRINWVRLERLELDKVTFSSYGPFRFSLNSGFLKEGWIEPEEAAKITKKVIVVNPMPEEPAPVVKDWVTIADNPMLGRVYFNVKTGEWWVEDYKKIEVKKLKPEEVLEYGVTESLKKQVELGKSLLDKIAKALPGVVVPIGGCFQAILNNFIWITKDLGIIQMVEDVPQPVKEFLDVAEKARVTINKVGLLIALPAAAIASRVVGVAGFDALKGLGQVGLTILGLGAFVPFIAEEAVQAAGFSVYMARQAKDPKLFWDAVAKYELAAKMGEAFNESIGIFNPLTYPSFKLFFQACKGSIQTYKQLVGVLEQEKRLEEERNKRFEEFLERDQQKTLAMVLNQIADSLKTIFYAANLGYKTLDLIDEKLEEAKEEETKSKLQELKERIAKRIEEIIEPYDKIAGRGLGVACELKDPNQRLTAISYIRTLRDEIEMLKDSIEAKKIEIKKEEVVPKPKPKPKPEKGWLYITSYPRYAKIYVDGEDIKKLTPEKLELTPGKHKIRLERYRRKPVEFEVEIKAGEKLEIYKYLPLERR